MQEIKYRELICKHRKSGILLATFLLALLMGFSGVQGKGHHTDRASYRDIFYEMRRVLRILEPILKPDAAAAAKKGSDSEVVGLGLLQERGIISPLPDGSWQPDQAITRGESLFYFGRMLQVLEAELVQPPIMLKIPHSFVDILPGHWLDEYLYKLAAAGALAKFNNSNRLNPDAIIQPEELRSLSSSIIDYLGSNLLICDFNGKSGRMLAKGAMAELRITEWEYSSNRRDWFQINEKGLVEPDFSAGNISSLFFKHSLYREAGPLELKKGSPAIGMIKLQRNYADFTKDRFVAQSRESGIEPDEEKEKIRQRLSQLLAHGNANIRSAQSEISVKKGDVVSTRDRRTEVLVKDHKDVESSDEANKAELVSESEYTASIVDALTSAPLKGAAVIIADNQITTDNEGKVSFTARPDSVLDITVYYEGYEALKIRHRVGYRAGPLTFALKPVFVSCSGRVSSIFDDRPIARSLVKIGTRATRTSADGSFVIRGIRPGFHQISVFAEKFLETHEIAHIGVESQQEINLQLRPVRSEDSEFLEDYQNL